MRGGHANVSGRSECAQFSGVGEALRTVRSHGAMCSLPVSPVFTKCSAMESEGGIALGALGAVPRFGFTGGAVGGAPGRGAEWSGMERSEVKIQRVRRSCSRSKGRAFSRCYARPRERANDGRVKSSTLARRSFGVLRRNWCGVRLRARIGWREAWCGRVWEGRVPPSLLQLALRPGLLTPLQTTRIPLLLPPLHTLQL